MSNYEVQARVMHQSNVMRDTIKSLNDWEKEMKRKEAQHKASNETEVRRNTFLCTCTLQNYVSSPF